MVKKRWGVKFYALAVSILAHVFALSIFAAVKLTQSQAATPNQTTAVVSVSQARVYAERPTVAAKPKVVSAGEEQRIVKSAKQGLSGNLRPVFESAKQDSQWPRQAPEGPQVDSFDDAVNRPDDLADDRTATGQVEFFDSPAAGGRICYVVDCSGSMQGLWGQVRVELCESIGRLQSDQYFSVIVFGAGSILESGGGRMVRASERAKKEAYEFIGAVQPRGATNAQAALSHAIKIRDGAGTGPSVIYFLTDGFELSEQGNLRFEYQVETMLKNNSPNTQINTIGFWSDERDSKLLEAIARKSGGRFTLVGRAGERQ